MKSKSWMRWLGGFLFVWGVSGSRNMPIVGIILVCVGVALFAGYYILLNNYKTRQSAQGEEASTKGAFNVHAPEHDAAPKPFYKRGWVWLIVVIIAAVAVRYFNTSVDAEQQAGFRKQPQPRNTAQSQSDIPSEYVNAVRAAKSYADNLHLSKARIYDQLISEYGEGFSEQAALYAINNITADWEQNALYQAQSYSDNQYMSKEAIYDQLVSEYGEEFTAAEADYAIENVVADWNINALITGQRYYDTMHMSEERIFEQLCSEYGEKFTSSEAQYATSHIDY